MPWYNQLSLSPLFNRYVLSNMQNVFKLLQLFYVKVVPIMCCIFTYWNDNPKTRQHQERTLQHRLDRRTALSLRCFAYAGAGRHMEMNLGGRCPFSLEMSGHSVCSVLVLHLRAGYLGVFSLWHFIELTFCELGCMFVQLKTIFKKCTWRLTLLSFISLSRKSLHKTNFYESQEVTELLSMHLVNSESWRFPFLPLPVTRIEWESHPCPLHRGLLVNQQRGPYWGQQPHQHLGLWHSHMLLKEHSHLKKTW